MNFFGEDPEQKYPNAVESMKKEGYEEIPIEITEERIAELSRGNEELEHLGIELMRYCCRYATDVWSMHERLTKGIEDKEDAKEYQDQDEARTRLHNALIDSFNVFSRKLAQEKRDNSWMASLVRAGEGSRAAYGRLALLLAYRHILKLNLTDKEKEHHHEGSDTEG